MKPAGNEILRAARNRSDAAGAFMQKNDADQSITI